MKYRKKPLFKRNEMDRSKYHGLFAITPIIPHLVIIVLVFAIYYYIQTRGYFPAWITYIYYATKVIIALEILHMATKSLIGSLLAIVLGALSLYWLQTGGSSVISMNDSWQLIIIGIIAFFFTFIIRSFKKRY